MSKLPSFQFYPGDWWKDPGIKMLSLEERGFWFQCLLIMHESDERGKMMINGKAMPNEGIAKVMGVDNHRVNQIIESILTYGVGYRCDETGALCSRRMIRDEETRKMRANFGKMGGNPALLNPKVNHVVNHKGETKVKPNPTPSSSSSSSDDKGDKSPWDGLPSALDSEAFKNAWTRYTTYRSERKLPKLKQVSIETQWNRMAQWGESGAIASINETIAQGWTGLFEPRAKAAQPNHLPPGADPEAPYGRGLGGIPNRLV